MRTREHCHVVNLDLDYDVWPGGLQRASFDGLKVWRGLNQFERDEEGNNALNSKAQIHKNVDQLIMENAELAPSYNCTFLAKDSVR